MGIFGVHDDGRTIHLETNAVPVPGPDGRLCQLAVTRDMTERRARDLALAASEGSLKQAIKATGLGIFENDHAAGKIKISPELRALVGVFPEGFDPTFDQCFEMVAPESRESCIAAVLASRDPSGDGTLQFDLAIVTPDGERRWLEVSAQTTFTGAGAQRVPERTIGAVRDVTDARKALEDIRDAEGKWRNLFNSMQEGFIVGEIIAPADGEPPDFRVIESNGQWEALTGVPVEEVLGKSFRAAVPGIEEFWYDTFYHVATTREAVTCERFVEPLGRWFEVRAYGHSPGKFAAVFLNITERKLSQAALEQAQQEQFRVSRLTAMGAMASTLAHELNQPLATSANYLNALLAQLDGRRLDASAMQRTASEALAACLRAGDIIKRTRAFAMEGQVVRRRESLGSVIEAAVNDFRRQHIATGVAIGVETPADELFVECDRIQIEQVLGNLLRNSAQAMADSPQKRIDIRAVRQGSKAVVLVEDSGPGLSSDLAEHLFDPFRTSKQDGLGLGLALCRTIIDAHKGTITGANRAQGGAVFELDLPPAA